MFGQIKKWLCRNKVYILSVVIAMLLIHILLDNSNNKNFKGVVETIVPKEPVVAETIEKDAILDKIEGNSDLKPKELKISDDPVVCPPSQTAFVLESKEDLLKDKRWFLVDLDTMEVTKVKKDSEDITVYYRLFGKKKIYLTIEEKFSDINYNKKEFEKTDIKKDFIKVEK